MKYSFLILLLTFSFHSFAKGKNAGLVIDPYFSATKGDFEFDNSYKGTMSAIGLGARVGSVFGPLYFAFDVHAQLPSFSDDDATQTQTDLSPIPRYKLWLSYGLAAGIKTNLFTVTYTHYFDSTLNTTIRNDRGGAIPDEDIDYKYHGKGSKIAALLHITKNISIGAELAKFEFDQYSLSRSTHVVPSADKESRDKLSVTSTSLLINYHIPITVQ